MIDIADPSYCLGFLFLGTPPPSAPGPEDCGVDGSEDDLECTAFMPCFEPTDPGPGTPRPITFEGVTDEETPGEHALDVSPQDEIAFMVRTSTPQRGGTVTTLELLGATGEVIWRENWLTRGGSNTIREFDDRGRLFAELHPTSLVIKSGADLDYEIDVEITPRPGYNEAGMSLHDALEITLPEFVRGNMRGEEPGHYRSVRIPPTQSIVIGGIITGPRETGANHEINVYSETGVLVHDRLVSGAAYGPENVEARFANETGAEVDYVIHLDSNSQGQARELRDYKLTIELE